MASSSWVASIFAPTLGTLIATFMWLSSIPAVRQVNQKKEMGELNPIPYCVGMCTTWGWSMYGYLRQDFFITCANFSGLAISMWCISSCLSVSNYSLAKKEARLGGIMGIVGRESGEAHENPLPKSKSASNTKLKSDGTTEIPESLGLGQVLGLELTEEEELARTHSQIFMLTHSVWGSALFWGLNGIISFVALGNKYSPSYQSVNAQGETDSESFVGWLCVVFTILYFGSPLSTMMTVINTRDSSSIDPKMGLCTLINTITWTVYGFAIDDAVVYGPNLAGGLLQTVNLTLALVFPRTLEIENKALSLLSLAKEAESDCTDSAMQLNGMM